MFWRKGEYAKVLEHAPEIVSWEKRLHRTESDSNEDEDLSLEIDRLIRAAVREEKFDLAIRHGRNLERINDFYMTAMVAIRKGDVELANQKLAACKTDDLQNLRTDSDLLSADLSPYPAMVSRTPSLNYEYAIDRDIDLDLLFDSEVELNAEVFKEMFPEGFGDGLSVSKINSVDGSDHWLIKTSDWTLVAVKKEFTHGTTDDIKNEKLKSAIEKAKYVVNISGYSDHKKAFATTKRQETTLMRRSLAIEKLLAIGQFNRWLDRKSFETNFEKEQQTGSAYLFTDTSPGIYHYPDVETDSATNAKFKESLITELRMFKNSNSGQRIDLQVMPDSELSVGVEVRLDRIIRQWSSRVRLIGTVTKAGDIFPFLVDGQSVEIPMESIHSFKILDVNGKVVSEMSSGK